MSNAAESHKTTLTTQSGQTYKYQTVTLLINNATPGMPVTVQLSGKAGQGVIMWSSGSPTQPSSQGMNMQVLTGSLPLTAFQVTSNQVNFGTSSGGSAVAFNFNAFLCGSVELSEFYVTLTSASPNTQASFQLQGQTSQILTLNRAVAFDWTN